ncbi:MAG: hypothetical protein LBB52_05020, partial [Desulfovibrio sp.]|nr:hypothetical protein [Desulfovibrio sp.]
ACDNTRRTLSQLRQGFNPRTRKACDTGPPCLISCWSSFNPRTRKACDADCPEAEPRMTDGEFFRRSAGQNVPSGQQPQTVECDF